MDIRCCVGLAVLVLLFSGCTRTGLQGPERTPEALVGKFDVLLGKSDRDMEKRLRSELKLYEVLVESIHEVEDGLKETYVKWSHKYVYVTAETVRRERLVYETTNRGKGRQEGKWVSRMVTETDYTYTTFSNPCQLRVRSRDGAVVSYTMEGDGCRW